MSITRPCGGAAATMGDQRVAPSASQSRQAASPAGSCGSTRTPGRTARASASARPGCRPSAAAAGQQARMIWRPRSLTTRTSGSGGADFCCRARRSAGSHGRHTANIRRTPAKGSADGDGRLGDRIGGQETAAITIPLQFKIKVSWPAALPLKGERQPRRAGGVGSKTAGRRGTRLPTGECRRWPGRAGTQQQGEHAGRGGGQLQPARHGQIDGARTAGLDHQAGQRRTALGFSRRAQHRHRAAGLHQPQSPRITAQFGKARAIQPAIVALTVSEPQDRPGPARWPAPASAPKAWPPARRFRDTPPAPNRRREPNRHGRSKRNPPGNSRNTGGPRAAPGGRQTATERLTYGNLFFLCSNCRQPPCRVKRAAFYRALAAASRTSKMRSCPKYMSSPPT